MRGPTVCCRRCRIDGLRCAQPILRFALVFGTASRYLSVLFSTNSNGGVTEIMMECPVCGGDIAAGSDLVVGELISCAECGSELEVTGLEPLAFAEAPESEEDWGQ